ncbi:DUF4407 domain-containing protein [Pedobacter cryotolerans]|uniref:DUF4407 domain-containing protein n=1 Tax=Pedobacter cryotolerans TaxID=2571270 RepID=A0A4U1CB32_9SPHI|nr:DUF4407 domain-containing protein [Pedobacter cryotolerans]TKC03195.1 DUF4407 domain-containing protein [Pedobacter cryotolerans]
MRDFFIWCSGASVEIVKKCDDKEISKYTNIGIVVFCVAVLSVFSATYFLSFAFNTESVSFVWLYLPIGIIWGFIILSLDRAIVATISKNDNLKIQILKSIPRIALALMIGIVVATPLEFKIFEKEVENKIRIKAKEKLSVANSQSIQNEVIIKQQEVESKKTAQVVAQSNLDREVKKGTGHGPGWGKLASSYKLLLDQATNKLNMGEAELDSLQLLKVNKINQVDSLQVDRYVRNNIGVSQRVNVLYYDLEGNTHLAITILFMLVELLPLLTKLMSSKGSYDELMLLEEKQSLDLANLKHRKDSELKSDLLSIANKKKIQIATIKREIEESLHREILTEVAKAQNQIALKRVKEFKANNLNNLNIPKSSPLKIENIFWLHMEKDKKIEFMFRNGKNIDNEFRLYEDDKVSIGIWNFDQSNNIISTEILGNKNDFEVLEIQSDKLKLKYMDTDYKMEFEKS